MAEPAQASDDKTPWIGGAGDDRDDKVPETCESEPPCRDMTALVASRTRLAAADHELRRCPNVDVCLLGESTLLVSAGGQEPLLVLRKTVGDKENTGGLKRFSGVEVPLAPEVVGLRQCVSRREYATHVVTLEKKTKPGSG